MTGDGRVFISHAYQDNDACQPLLKALASWDVDYWFQEERAEADESLAPMVELAIAERDIFLRVLSRAAQASYWVRLETATFQRLRADERQRELTADVPTDALPGAGSDAATDTPHEPSGSADAGDQEGAQDGPPDIAQDEPASDPQDASSSNVADDLADDASRDSSDDRADSSPDGMEGGEAPPHAGKRILIDLSLDGTVAGETGDEDAAFDDVYIDMTRSHGLEWREHLRQALGLIELGTETGEVPAITVDAATEALRLTRIEAQDRAEPPEADDRIVSVAIANQSAESGVSSPRGVCLIMTQGANVGRVYPLHGGRTALGRRRDSDIFLEDVTVSRLHAALVRDPNGRFVLYDEGSKNGTFVNGQLITERVLEDGDSIRMGQIVLRFHLPRRND